jgi:hypothetical protein
MLIKNSLGFGTFPSILRGLNLMGNIGDSPAAPSQLPVIFVLTSHVRILGPARATVY